MMTSDGGFLNSTDYPDGWRFDTRERLVTEPTGRVYSVTLCGLDLVDVAASTVALVATA